ncbi:uncharacterized protein LOC109797026 [Cajanus cajan]|uniref:uncharacterized protein LOC109797026 n=1 Tax=Cajanus cajan TaxID=3821 RepID=UPI00098D7F11|nr:uncharacterized protein LOC109797026 [Cajanus cajan]
MLDNRGEEESNTTSWLVLTQLLVLLLLLGLLFFFAVFPLDPDDNHVAADAPPSLTSSGVFLIHDIQPIESPLPLANRDSSPSHPTTRQHRLQGGQNLLIKGEIETGPSMIRREEIAEEEEDSSLYVHPCHYFQLATVAFLKCFGLDSTSDSPSTRKHRKRKEN